MIINSSVDKINKSKAEFKVRKVDSHWLITFACMASPCEILIRCKDKSEAEHLASLSFSESNRLEQKFSRYINDNIVFRINNSNGAAVELDDELMSIITYADECYKLSDGMFDITSGVLRRAWKFDGSEYIPDKKLIKSLSELVGWEKIEINNNILRLLPGMEIDFGGLVKEYAVDKVADLLFQESGAPLMANFGGDIRAITSEQNPIPWVVGIEDPEQEDTAIGEIKLTNGAIATSGDIRRFCLVDGNRMGHILNPKTGWPVTGGPRSITVLGNFCVEAGFLATLAMLHGPNAEEFLKHQNVSFRCVK